MEWMAFYLFAAVFVLLLSGYPVAFTLAGTERSIRPSWKRCRTACTAS